MSRKLGILRGLRVVRADRYGRLLSLVGDDLSGTRGVNIASMGEGVSQVLPILSRLFETRFEGPVVIEQPEIHLHPKLQADLADVFVERVKSGKVGQILVETHSEHLLLRLRRRIADRTISASKVAILFVERRGRSSAVRNLSLSESGEISDWPRGFFEEGFQDALAIARAKGV